MGLMRAQNRQGASHRDGRRFGLKVAVPVENGGLLEYFFGKDGRTCLHQERFVQFLRDFHDEILRLAHHDYRSCGTISAKDFALSLVASADIRHISKLLDRVDEVSNEPQIRDIRITFEEFKNFAELRRQLHLLNCQNSAAIIDEKELELAVLPNHVKYCVSVCFPSYEQLSVHHRSPKFPTIEEDDTKLPVKTASKSDVRHGRTLHHSPARRLPTRSDAPTRLLHPDELTRPEDQLTRPT
ncbi:hypothetical protein NC651_038992 [Populus alba x Populus x berolinensis]|nr:hypothetical protein NC651_038992 [Populus alba x Populus x berolinensis]